MTTRERLYLFDATLRDGAQTTGVDFSLTDKRRVAVVSKQHPDHDTDGWPAEQKGTSR